MITEAFRKLFKKLLDENGGGGGEPTAVILYGIRLSSGSDKTLYTDRDCTKIATIADVEGTKIVSLREMEQPGGATFVYAISLNNRQFDDSSIIVDFYVRELSSGNLVPISGGYIFDESGNHYNDN